MATAAPPPAPAWTTDILLALLAGCAGGGSEAQRYRDALAAADWATARHGCESLAAERDRQDCLLAVMERHDRLDRDDCAALPPGLFFDECLFQLAERANVAGDLELAFTACEESRFGRECSYHLLRQAARGVVDASIPDVARAIDPYRTLARAPDAPALFWKAWFREHAGRGDSIDPAPCPDDACRAAGREVVYQRLNGTFQADPARWCAQFPAPGSPDPVTPPDAPPTSTGAPAWVRSEVVDGWVVEWSRRNCARWADPHPPPSRALPG